AGFRPGQGGAKTEVRTMTEGQVVAGAAPDVEPVGGRTVLLRVAIPRSPPKEDPRPGRKGYASELGVVLDDPRVPLDRWFEAQRLFEHGRDHPVVVGHDLELVAMREEKEHGRGQQAGRRLVAAGEEDADEIEHLGHVERPFILDPGGHQLADEVVARLDAPLLDEGGEVVLHLDEASLALEGPLSGDIGGDGVGYGIGPALEVPVVLDRYAESVADHFGRERHGELGEELDGAAVDESVDQLVDDGRHARLQGGHGPDTEGPVHELAVPAVLRGVVGDEGRYLRI